MVMPPVSNISSIRSLSAGGLFCSPADGRAVYFGFVDGFEMCARQRRQSERRLSNNSSAAATQRAAHGQHLLFAARERARLLGPALLSNAKHFEAALHVAAIWAPVLLQVSSIAGSPHGQIRENARPSGDMEMPRATNLCVAVRNSFAFENNTAFAWLKQYR